MITVTRRVFTTQHILFGILSLVFFIEYSVKILFTHNGKQKSTESSGKWIMSAVSAAVHALIFFCSPLQ